jgi:hypothetical protein
VREVAFLERQAKTHGEAVGRFDQALLEGPLLDADAPRLRAAGPAQALRDAGEGRLPEGVGVGDAPRHRLERMIGLAAPSPVPSPTSPKAIPLARHLRPASQYLLPLKGSKSSEVKR